MKNFACTHDGSLEVFIQVKGTQTGLYCSECGKWIKWLSKDEIKLAEMQIEEVLKGKKAIIQNTDEELEKLCKLVSNHIFNNSDKYDPYTKVIITGTSIEIVPVIKGIPVKRWD